MSMTEDYRDPDSREMNESSANPAPAENAAQQADEKMEAAPVQQTEEKTETAPVQQTEERAEATPAQRTPAANPVQPPRAAVFHNGAFYGQTQPPMGGYGAPGYVPRQAPTPQSSWQNPVPPQPPRKKKRTGVVVGIAIAVLAYLILLGLVLGMIVGRGGAVSSNRSEPESEQSENANTEPKRDNAPIVTEKGKDGNGAIVNPDYTGETLTPAEVYRNNVDCVVYVEALFSNKKGMGSGFVIDDENGYILTNHHVVADSEDVSITLNNGESYKATVIGGDEINDVAVLKVDAPNLRKVTIGDSDKIEIGSYVNVIGNPLGDLTFTITRGVIGGVARSIPHGEYNVKVFQTDAAINGGNSGGPALDDTGAVIGIASAKYADVAVEGICFCIPINDAIAVAKDLVDYGYVKGRPNFGVVVSTSSGYAYSTDAFGRRTIVETMPGAVVEKIDENACAAKAGLKVGDVITKLGDVRIDSASKLINEKLNYKAGDTVTMTVFRDEEEITLTVTLDEYKPD